MGRTGFNAVGTVARAGMPNAAAARTVTFSVDAGHAEGAFVANATLAPVNVSDLFTNGEGVQVCAGDGGCVTQRDCRARSRRGCPAHPRLPDGHPAASLNAFDG